MPDQLPDCSELEILLDAFYDNELSEEEGQSVTAHLKQCDPCQTKVKEIGLVAASLRNLPRMSMSRELPTDWAAVMKSVNHVASNEAANWQANSAKEEHGKVVSLSGASGQGGKRLDFRRSLALPVAAAAVLLVLATAGLQLRPVSGPTALSDRTTRSPGEVASVHDPNSAKLALRSHPGGSPTASSAVADSASGAAASQQGNELLALYGGGESNLASEDLGISTDEDGLYALKL